MGAAVCHAEAERPKELARNLVLKTLGAKRVASWCNVGEASVYQWLSRGTDERPIPVDRVSAIIEGARNAEISFDAHVLWPSMPRAL